MRYDFWKRPKMWGQQPGMYGTWDAFHYKPSRLTLKDEVKREHQITRAIQRDPFKHLPAGMGFGKNWLAMGYGICW